MMSRHRKLERKVDQEGQLTSLRRDSSKETHHLCWGTIQPGQLRLPLVGGGGAPVAPGWAEPKNREAGQMKTAADLQFFSSALGKVTSTEDALLQ